MPVPPKSREKFRTALHFKKSKKEHRPFAAQGKQECLCHKSGHSMLYPDKGLGKAAGLADSIENRT